MAISNFSVDDTIRGSLAPGYERVGDVFRGFVENGWDTGAGVSVYVRGEPVVRLTGGMRTTTAAGHNGNGSIDALPYDDQTIQLVASTTKFVESLCVMMLVDRGLLSYDDRIVDHWPGFAGGHARKEQVTVRQLMMHRAGLPVFERKLGDEELFDHNARGRFLERSAAAEAAARDRFGPGRHVARLRDRLGPPQRPLVRGAALGDGGWGRRGPRRVLLVTSNGVGLGHLTRMLALARRLPPGIEPVFATMSAALPLVRREGFAVEHLAFHGYGRLDIDRWNRFLARELSELFRLHRPAVVVFDRNMLHGGLLDALRGLPAAWAVWMRRAMWRPGSGAEALRREPAFDAVLEPGELACAVDRGPTLGRRGLTRTLGPVLLCDPDERLPRPAARAALGLPAGGTCVLLQLGSGNNFDYRAAARRVRAVLRRHPGAILAVAESP
jgi:CubicO group peptidase (beta-lactamase class C family)